MSSRPFPFIAYVGLGAFLSVSYIGLATAYDRYRRTLSKLDETRAEITALKTQTSDKDASIHELKQSLSDATLEMRRMREAGVRAMQDAQRDLRECRRNLENAQSANQALEDEVRAQADAAKLARDAVARLSEVHEGTVELLKTRTLELNAAETFLNKADSSSGADVIGMVEALNGEIFQTAATIAEAFKFGEKQIEDSEDLLSAHGDVVDILGTRMTDLLRSSSHHDDQLLIQLALQAAMCAYMEWIITSWYFEGRDEEELLSNLYNYIQDGEDQAIAGRWRALTRKYAVAAFTKGSDIHRQLVDVVMETLVNILISAGLEAATSQVSETMAAQFAGQASEVVRQATHLNWVIGQTVTSCELAPVYIVPDTEFDGKSMEDSFGKGEETEEVVLCTTDLGLIRRERHDGVWHSRVLKKSKVAFKSGLDESLNTLRY